MIKATKECDNPDAHDKLGLIFFREGDYDNAKLNYEQALSLNSACGDAIHHMSIMLYTMDNREEAVSMCQDALNYIPNSALAHLNFGTMLYNNQAYGASIKQLERALELAPGSTEARIRLEAALDRHGALQYEAEVEDNPSNYTSTVLPKPKQSAVEGFIKWLGVGCRTQSSRAEVWADFEPVVNMEGLEDQYVDVIPDFKNL